MVSCITFLRLDTDRILPDIKLRFELSDIKFRFELDLLLVITLRRDDGPSATFLLEEGGVRREDVLLLVANFLLWSPAFLLLFALGMKSIKSALLENESDSLEKSPIKLELPIKLEYPELSSRVIVVAAVWKEQLCVEEGM